MLKENKTISVQILMSKTERNQLKQQAVKEDRSQGSIVRLALKQYYEKVND